MYKNVTLLIFCLTIAACSSAPSWQGMSETEIANWKNIGVNVEQVQAYVKAGLSSNAISTWQDNDFTDQQTILAWSNAQFSASDAKQWRDANFSLADAKDWSKEKFSAENAKQWRNSNFTLRQAVTNRSKGLQPVK